MPLLEKQTAKLATARLTTTANTEMAALPVVAWAAAGGVGFDPALWEDVAAETTTSAGQLRERLDQLVPNGGNLFGVTNWNSPDAVAVAFAAQGVARTSTDDDALAALSKRSGAYGREWLRHVAPDDRVYATRKQTGPRGACRARANLQQLPRAPRYRRCLVVLPDRVLVKAD